MSLFWSFYWSTTVTSHRIFGRKQNESINIITHLIVHNTNRKLNSFLRPCKNYKHSRNKQESSYGKKVETTSSSQVDYSKIWRLYVLAGRKELPRLLTFWGCPRGVMVRGCPRGVMVKAINCGIVVREFVLQSRYYVHFRANTLGKGMNPLILPPAMGK